MNSCGVWVFNLSVLLLRLCVQTHIDATVTMAYRYPAMNHKNPPSVLVLQRFVLIRIVCCALVPFMARADALPAFAFSISSNQIPGGIWPLAVGSDEASKIYISSLSSMIQTDTNGTLLHRWGGQGAGPGQFSYAGQMAFDGAGHFFVLDSYNYRVEEFDTNGTFITAWGSQGSGPGQFDGPDGLAVSRSGRIYVSDSINFRIQVFSAPGVFLEQFGTLGTNTGQFDFPEVIAVDSSNNLYVIDVPGGSFDNYRVQKFDADGHFLLEWGPPEVDTSRMIQIGGITTDAANNVYVADSANNQIQKYTSNGAFLSQWGSLGSGPGQFNGPSGVALDPSGNYVYVADYYNERVDVFAYSSLGPLIYQPPTNQIVPAGATLELDAGVFGAQPLSFQWQFNGTNIEGATQPVLLISNVSLTASGSYLISVSNTLGIAVSPSATISVMPTIVTTLAASSISATSAVLNASVWVGGNSTTAWFEWGTNSDYGSFGGFTNINPNAVQRVSLKLTDLNGEEVYHYRVGASNILGVVSGQDMSFQVGLKPTVVTFPVVPTGLGTVLLSGSVNPEARDTTTFFQWGKYGLSQYTSTNHLPNGVLPVTIQEQVTNLQPGAIYEARTMASNQLGTVMGAVVNFIAPPWILLPVPPNQIWASLAVSADGTRLTAASSENQVYLSPDSGMTWISNSLAGFWHAITISADGNRVVLGSGGANTLGPAYFSTNGAKSWIKANSPNRNWYALASSGDGIRMAAADATSQVVLTSTNSGKDWQTNSPSVTAHWDTIASSADGRHLIVAAGVITNGPVYTSADAGLSWTSNDLPVTYWHSVASSADGQVLLAAVGGPQPGRIYISTNSGGSWAVISAPITNWQSVAISADGSKLAALARQTATPVFTSTNLGATWESAVLPEALWSDVVLSADGSKLFASGDQHIVMLQTPTQPRLGMALESGNVSLSWVIPSTPVVLQQTANLSNPQWVDFPVMPVAVLTNLKYEATVPTTNSSGFYRLRASP